VTIGSSVQAFSVTAMRLSISVRPPAPPSPSTAAATATPPTRTDTVSISGAAASAAPVGTAAPPTERTKAGGLLDALDSDKNGVLSKAEFTEGASALLRGSGDRRSVNAGRGSERGEERSSGRLERKLARAFRRIDGNDDGAIDEAELGAALSRRRPEAAEPLLPEGAPAPDGGASVSISYVRVSYLSVALQRYNSLQPSQQPAQAAGNTTGTGTVATPPAPEPTTPAPAPTAA
jgi:hypothetical protein